MSGAELTSRRTGSSAEAIFGLLRAIDRCWQPSMRAQLQRQVKRMEAGLHHVCGLEPQAFDRGRLHMLRSSLPRAPDHHLVPDPRPQPLPEPASVQARPLPTSSCIGR